MYDQLKEALLSTSALREDQKHTSRLVLENPTLVKPLLELIFSNDAEVSHKAAWILEFVCKEKLSLLFQHLDYFLTHAGKLQESSAIRPCAKVIQLMCEARYVQEITMEVLYLPRKRKEKLTEICFDWLIADIKVAPKAYSIYSLYWLGKDIDWIYPALIAQLKKDAPDQSAGYRATARKILKKIEP
ncbi:hypothetical protein GCM10009117_10850 [Gangjinia marincola]|uniref:Adenylosuccinate lyase n=1 Tax=Gangjinia marincola TaxID=578463 RepID=A0ABN1MFS0_9FLAO